MDKGAEIVGPKHGLYCQADRNLNEFGRSRYDANVSSALEAQLLDFMKKYYNIHGGEKGLMIFLGYDDSMLVPTQGGPPTGFIKKIKKDLIQGEVELEDDYNTIENAVRNVVTDQENHDGCLLVDLEGKLHSGYEVDACAYKVFDAVNTSLNEIRHTFFNNHNFGATRFESIFKALVLAVNSNVGYIKDGNGFYFLKNEGGEIYIPDSINPTPEPLPQAKLDTNIGLEGEGKAEPVSREKLFSVR
jgi:hypothetical protein